MGIHIPGKTVFILKLSPEPMCGHSTTWQYPLSNYVITEKKLFWNFLQNSFCSIDDDFVSCNGNGKKV